MFGRGFDGGFGEHSGTAESKRGSCPWLTSCITGRSSPLDPLELDGGAILGHG